MIKRIRKEVEIRNEMCGQGQCDQKPELWERQYQATEK